MAEDAFPRKWSQMDLTLIAAAALGAWLYLALFRGQFWRASERLNDAPAPSHWPEIVAVIPARDEAATISAVIAAHMGNDYPGTFSIILVDDGSTDSTAGIARQAAKGKTTEGKDRSFEIIAAPDLQPGWTGKLWAVHHGLGKAKEIASDAKYCLLADADIVLASDTLRRLVAKAERDNLALASLMARLQAKGQWGALLIPAFIYFFQKLYPFPRINDSSENTAGAAGGCMLVRSDALHDIGGIEAIKNELIDDCALARRIKDITPSTRIWLGLAEDEAASLRDNSSLASIWTMVARTAYAQLGHSPLLLAGAVIGMALIYLAPPLIILTIGSHWSMTAVLYALMAWGLMAYTYWPTLKLYDRPPWEAAFLPAAATLYTAMMISSAYRHRQGLGGQWKGRTY